MYRTHMYNGTIANVHMTSVCVKQTLNFNYHQLKSCVDFFGFKNQRR